MSAIKNCARIVNDAKGSIAIEKDSNFDDMILVVDGVRQDRYVLRAGQAAYVGATYANEGAIVYDDDMGLTLTYQPAGQILGDERYLEIGVPNDSDGSSEIFSVISDSEEGDDKAPLRYTVSNQSSTSITLTFSDKCPTS